MKRLVLAAALLAAAATLRASCIAPPEEGTWVNGEKRLQIRFVCQDVVVNGQPQPPGPAWYIDDAGARQLETGQIYAVFESAEGKRHVYAKMSAHQPGKLWVYVVTGERGAHEWFTRAR